MEGDQCITLGTAGLLNFGKLLLDALLHEILDPLQLLLLLDAFLRLLLFSLLSALGSLRFLPTRRVFDHARMCHNFVAPSASSIQ